MKPLLIIIALLVAPCAHAQDKFTMSFFLAGATFDAVTTFHNVRAGGEEMNPAYAFVKDKPVGLVISLAATDAALLWAAHHYSRTHPTAARVLLLFTGSVHVAAGAHNAMSWAAWDQVGTFHNTAAR